MAESTAQRVRVGPLAVSVDKQKPLLGAKVSKVRLVKGRHDINEQRTA
ncbi:hypothetical protein N9L76_04620 [bacterium]|nr:hypothetical protein [bacterium]